MQTRRDFLKLAAMLSGAAGTAGFLPDSIQRAYAIEPAPGSTWTDAEHIVILMQENRSFDHALGTLQGVRGFNDPRALKLGNGNSVFVQADAEGNSYAPWRFDIRDTRVTWMGSIPHSRNSQVDAWNEGQHDGWIEAKRSGEPEYEKLPLTMGHYTREDLPFYYALADAFTVCDQNYCSVMTSTTPNRCYFWTGTIRDKQSTDSRVFMRNEQIDIGGMTWKTYPERLSEAGISWKFYQNELTNVGGLTDEEDSWLGNFGCNLLEDFSAYYIEANPGYRLKIVEEISSLAERNKKLEDSLATEKDEKAAAAARSRIEHNLASIAKWKEALADCGEARYNRLNPQQQELHHAAFITNAGDAAYRSLEPISFEDGGKEQSMNAPKGDVLYQFRKDVNEGKLPAISWLSSPENFSDHPTSPWYGAWYVSEVMDILTKNPEVWKKTIFVLTYDENDGYFDHAPSFAAPDPKRPETGRTSEGLNAELEYTYREDELRQGVAEKYARTGPVGMGFRVPMVIASPWSRGGWVNSQLFDHTSTLMFLEQFVQKKYGKTVKEENISGWRRAISGDLTTCFRPHHENEPQLDFLNRDKFVVGIQKARYKEIPSNYQRLTAAQVADITHNLRASNATSHQEHGTRPSCALPSEWYVDGNLSQDGSHFEVSMTAATAAHGASSSGAPFNVYLRNTGSQMRAATYTVKAGDTLRETFPLTLFQESKYSVDIHGPNGFYRSFSGNELAGGVEARAAYEKKGTQLTGNVQLHLRNRGKAPVAVSIVDNSYKTGNVRKTISAGHETSVVLNLKNSHGWYDFTVRTDDNSTESRYAGRVETGKHSVTDPFMGGVV